MNRTGVSVLVDTLGTSVHASCERVDTTVATCFIVLPWCPALGGCVACHAYYNNALYHQAGSVTCKQNATTMVWSVRFNLTEVSLKLALHSTQYVLFPLLFG